MVGMPEVELGIDFCSARGFKEVGGAREWVSVFLRDLVEPVVVHAQSEASIFFPHEEDRRSVRRVGGSDETAPNVVFNEGSEGTQL
jgi:hypothetical protein